jgi:thymidylate synthase
MLHIQTTSANEAWRTVLKTVFDQGEATGNDKYYRDEVVLVEIGEPTVEPADPRFPMAQADLDIINRYIYTGENEDKVVHDWTKLYYHRAFDQPNSQIEFMISNLGSGKPVGETQISMWDKNIDQGQKVSPCTQIIWARIKHGKLELHVHAHSSDAYKKALMNMLEFISLQHYIANRVGVPVGKYYHFLDSCHIHNKDLEAVKEVVAKLS